VHDGGTAPATWRELSGREEEAARSGPVPPTPFLFVSTEIALLPPTSSGTLFFLKKKTVAVHCCFFFVDEVQHVNKEKPEQMSTESWGKEQ
jgi:hypothetical protein